MAKQDICRQAVTKLSQLFSVPTPELNLVANPGVYGLYFRNHSTPRRPEPRNVITLNPRSPVETLCHEFAHHLDYEQGLGSHEPPVNLPNVRAVVAGEAKRHTYLDHQQFTLNQLKRWS